MRLRLSGVAFGFLCAGCVYAQYVISAHSGVIQLVEGKAYLNDKAVDPKFGQFPDIKDGQEFRTEEGRAEVLLTPGVFLRIGENSSIQMVSSRLTDTRVEVLSGSVIVECDEIPKDNSIMLLYKGNTMMLVKHGLYRVDSDPGRLQVYDGEAIIKADSGQLTLKGGKQTSLTGVLMAESFDKNEGDELYRWSSRRANYLARANVSSAMSMRGSGDYYTAGGLGGFGGWQFNPMFGLFSYVPYSGYGYSPFGYGLWSPYTVMYAPYIGGGGYGGARTPVTAAVASSGRSPFNGSSSPFSRGVGSSSSGFAAGPTSSGGRMSGGGGGMSSGGGAISSGGGMSAGGGHGGGGHR